MTVNGHSLAIKDVMRKVIVVESGMAFRDVIKKMIVEKTNSLVVIDAQGKAIGMVNPKSLIKHVVPDYLEHDAIAAHFAEYSHPALQKTRNISIWGFSCRSQAFGTYKQLQWHQGLPLCLTPCRDDLQAPKYESDTTECWG